MILNHLKKPVLWVINWDDMLTHTTWHSVHSKVIIVGNKYENKELCGEE